MKLTDIAHSILKENTGSPFPEEFHEFLNKMKHEFPGADAHKVMRENLKTIAITNGIDAAVDYVLQQFPQYENYKKHIKNALLQDKINKPVKFIE